MFKVPLLFNSEINDKYIENLNHFRFLIQIILDGYGVGKKDSSNAIFQAKTPYMEPA